MKLATILTKVQTLLNYAGTIHRAGAESIVIFRHPDHNEISKNRGHRADREWRTSVSDWREMGRPNEITMTIEPGDRLKACNSG